MNEIIQNEWQQKEWECYKDISTCVLGYFCPLCLICKNAQDLGESCCMYCCLAFICPPLGTCLLRQKARAVYSIEGESIMDFLWSWCCGPCVSCQTQSEIKHRTGLMT